MVQQENFQKRGRQGKILMKHQALHWKQSAKKAPARKPTVAIDAGLQQICCFI